MIGLALIVGLIKGTLHFKNLIQRRFERTREKKRNLELKLHEEITKELTNTETADPNQTTRQDAISLAEQEPEIERITYP